MNAVTTYQQNLPDAIEDLSRFLLIAPEKATALRAEIRAIQRVGLAKEVYDQKLEEQRRLCDMILDASVKLGDLTKAMPKAPPGRKPEITDSTVGYSAEKTKSERITNLGFTPKQVERFETLADNKDLVEQEKAAAREEGRMPTRTNVLELAQERRRLEREEHLQIDADYENLKVFRRAMQHPDLYALTEEILDSVVKVDDELSGTISELAQYIEHLTTVKNKLILKGASYGKTKRGQ